MSLHLSRSARRLGFWSAVLTTFFSIAYDVAQLAEWNGMLGSQGGPESPSSPVGLANLLTPSLLLGSSFLVLMVSVHQIAAPARKAWSHAAVAFATAYATLTGLVYFVQLTLVAPRIADGRMRDIEVLRFVPFDSFLYAVDILGYTFMCAAALFAGMVFTGPGLERGARWLLLANGLLIPFLVFQLYYHPLIWGASLWGILFPAATWTLAVLFARARGAPAGRPVPPPDEAAWGQERG